MKVMEIRKASDDRRPVLVIVVGRQRVGKTSFLNTTAQFLRERGAIFEIWDADKLNTTYNMSMFHGDSLQPPSSDREDVKDWLEQRCADLCLRKCSAMLDVGGGDTPLARLVEDVPIVAELESEGVRIVVVHVIGPELADLDYLERFQEESLLAPEATLIVLNSGLILSGRSIQVAFAQIITHATVTNAMRNGAVVAMMPRLACMSQVTDRGLTFLEAMNGVSKNGQGPLALFDKARVRKWWNEELPVFYNRGIPALWLPEVRSVEVSRSDDLLKEGRKRGKPTSEAGDVA
jgi:hypothetical protein